MLTVQADVGDEHDMQRVYKQAMERFERVDVVFANAGINGVWAPIDELEPEEWDRTIRTNLRGTFLTVKYAVPHLKQHGKQDGDERRASIIITASVNGTRIFSNTGATAYSCTKAAQLAMMQMTGAGAGGRIKSASTPFAPVRSARTYRCEHRAPRSR